MGNGLPPNSSGTTGSGDSSLSKAWRWDVVGLPWTEAEPLLCARGLRYDTVITAPPSRPVGDGALRVVAQQSLEDRVRIVLAYREYHRADSSPS